MRIQTRSFSEHTRIDLPAEFTVDELPKPATVDAAFGRYRSRVEAADERQLVVERSLNLTAAAIPAAEYETARVFFERILQAEQAPVVLRRAPASAAPLAAAPPTDGQPAAPAVNSPP